MILGVIYLQICPFIVNVSNCAGFSLQLKSQTGLKAGLSETGCFPTVSFSCLLCLCAPSCLLTFLQLLCVLYVWRRVSSSIFPGRDANLPTHNALGVKHYSPVGLLAVRVTHTHCSSPVSLSALIFRLQMRIQKKTEAKQQLQPVWVQILFKAI